MSGLQSTSGTGSLTTPHWVVSTDAGRWASGDSSGPMTMVSLPMNVLSSGTETTLPSQSTMRATPRRLEHTHHDREAIKLTLDDKHTLAPAIPPNKVDSIQIGRVSLAYDPLLGFDQPMPCYEA